MNKVIEISDPNIFRADHNTHPRLHSKYLDRDLGFKIGKIEMKLLQQYQAYDKGEDQSNRKKHYEGTQTWVGLNPQVLQTTYTDIYNALMHLKNFPISKVVDIGAGYGRVGLVTNSIYPNASFEGFEIIKKRQTEGNRIFKKYNLERCYIFNQDVLEDDFQLPAAQIYFIYDFSETEDLVDILEQLLLNKSREPFFLITHGERIDYLMNGKYREFWNKNGFLKMGNIKIYSSKFDIKRSRLWQQEK
jgi:16S rRNA G527 N7-methylase RsmG